MATVEFRYDPKNTAWFTANAAMVLKAGEPAYHDTTGLFKLGDGVTALSALSFLPTVTASTPTIQQVLTAGQVATTTIETTGFVKTGGLSTQFLKADGTVDSSTYLTTLGTAATSLTTTGSSGAATLIANVLNVPNYTLAGLGGTTLAAVNAQNLSVFAATTSSQLAGVISDETGSGALVFGNSPTFVTNITTPKIIGGTAIGSKVNYTSTTGVGTTTAIAHEFYVGNNGSIEALRILNNGRIGINTNPTYQFCVNGSDTANDGILISSSNYVNVPNPGTVTNSTLITGRGFNMATDSTVLTGSYVPTLGIGLASNRSGALLGLKNTSTSGYSILIEDGNMGVFTTNPYTELQVAGNITTTWANSNIGTWYQDGTSYRLGFNTNISNRQLNLHAYTADTGGYITFSTGTSGSPFVNLRINPAQTSGSLVNYDFTNPTSTNLNLSTNIPNFRISGANKQWATGTVANQYWNYLTANTASFVGASTLTNSYGLFVEAATAGTNATITNNWAIGTNGNIAIQSATATVSAPIGTLTLYGNSQTILNTSGVQNIICDYYKITFNGGTITSGSHTTYLFNASNFSNQTASTNLPNFRVNGSSKQWLTGAITNQYWNYFSANTASFVGASTITNSYGLFVETATAGTNATITNNYAAGFSGNVNVIGSLYSTGFRLVDGTQALNKVLVSDANGNASWATSSAGYAKSINNIAINTTGAAVANTDYYYFCTATLTFTLPTAVGNTNTYYIKVTSGTLTIDTSSSQTIDGSLTIVTSVANTAFTLISDGTNWQII